MMPSRGYECSIMTRRRLVSSTWDWASSRSRARDAVLASSDLLVKHGRGLLHFELLLREAEIDLAFLTLDGADDGLFGGFELGLFDLVGSGLEVELVLFGGDAGLGDGLVERGLGLGERGCLLFQFLLRAAGIELDDDFTGLDGSAGGGQPDDLKIRHIERRGELDGAVGAEFPTAVHEHEKVALTGGGSGEIESGGVVRSAGGQSRNRRGPGE